MLHSNSSHVVNSRDTWHSIEIGEHARVQREEIEAFHSARSKEFPTPVSFSNNACTSCSRLFAVSCDFKQIIINHLIAALLYPVIH